MAAIGVSEAARLVGRDVSTLHRMMKSGRLAYTVDRQGHRRIDSAELERAFDLDGVHGTATMPHSAASHGDSADVITLLREAVQCRDAMLDDLRQRLDASEAERRQLSERLTGLLSHRQSGSVPMVQRAPARVPWWLRWLR
ncbi:MAG: helix-turn-helix domain-containing protein [Acidobacteria bacterium]|nr:helix-turn-helix domain-containing protein [Acidobacteriota bacterium]